MPFRNYASTVPEFLRTRVERFEVPRHFFHCSKSDLPFTDGGKIDERRLGSTLAERIAARDGGKPAGRGIS